MQLKLSNRTDYALKAVLCLSEHYVKSSKTVVRSAVISESEMIPPKFLVQILLSLCTSGLINSVRGSSGGYYLMKPPSDITLGDVIRTAEHKDFLVHEMKVTERTSEVELVINEGLSACWNVWNNCTFQQLLDRKALKIKKQKAG